MTDRAVLFSIKPKYCELIASGKKTVEVRKTRPKIPTPFKGYIYCTNPNTKNPHEILEIHSSDEKIRKANGKVIGEFVCDEITEYPWGIGGHSHSYFTLKELIDFQRTIKPLKQRGMVDKETQYALDNFGVLPSVWCQMTNEPGWEWREWKEENKVLEPLIEDLKRRANELGVVYDFMWDRDYEAAYNRSDLIRIVFWFDN